MLTFIIDQENRRKKEEGFERSRPYLRIPELDYEIPLHDPEAERMWREDYERSNQSDREESDRGVIDYTIFNCFSTISNEKVL
jgi:hypothetical protein